MEDEELEQAVGIVSRAIPGGTINCASGAAEGPDFRVKTKWGSMAVEVKGLRTARLSDLEGMLASATLTAQRMAKESPKKSVQPLAMVRLPKLGPKSLDFARQFMAREAPEVGWCLFDPHGAYQLEIPSRRIALGGKPEFVGESRPQLSRGTLFSDLNCWMLKILLMRDVPKKFWGGPTQRILSIKDLMVVAKVSQQTAYSFVRTFESAGYVRDTSEGIVVVRRSELIRSWLSHDAAFHASRVPVRSIVGTGQGLSKILNRRNCPEQFAVTGFEACRMLSILHTAVPAREVCLKGSIETAMDAWQLQSCEARDAELFISKLAHPKSILGGRVVKENLPVVDVLEAALSVYGQSPRGPEQASYVFEHVLKWGDCV